MNRCDRDHDSCVQTRKKSYVHRRYMDHQIITDLRRSTWCMVRAWCSSAILDGAVLRFRGQMSLRSYAKKVAGHHTAETGSKNV
eukprot:s4463_g1.t1